MTVGVWCVGNTMPSLRVSGWVVAGVALAAPGGVWAQTMAASPSLTPVTPSVRPYVPPEPSLGSLRGLPVCPEGAPRPSPGQRYVCRPPWRAGTAPNMAFTLDVGTGYADAANPLTHSVFVFGAEGTWFPARSFGLGLRYQFVSATDAGADGPDDDLADDADEPNLSAHLVSVGPRLRLWNDDVDRAAWLLEGDLGWAFVPNGSSPGGPFVRAAVGRQIGALLGDNMAGQIGLVLAAQQGLADASSLRTLTLSARWQGEGATPEPRDLGHLSRPAGLHYTFGLRWYLVGIRWGGNGGAAISPGGALTFGLPINRWIEPRVQADMAYLAGLRGADLLTFSGMGGLRVRFNAVAPLFVEGLAGYQFAYGTAPRDFESGPVGEVGLGVHFAGCGVGVSLGMHYRRGLGAANDVMSALLFGLDIAYGSLPGAAGDAWAPAQGRPYRCSAPEAPSVPLPPRPPPPPPPPPPSQPTIPVYAVTPPRVGVQVAVPRVEVEPVQVEVVIGASFLGGMVRVQVNPALLPLARLRAAGLVDVRVEGPPEVLFDVEAQLQAIFNAEGVAVRGYTRAAVSGSTVRAIFTLFPRR